MSTSLGKLSPAPHVNVNTVAIITDITLTSFLLNGVPHSDERPMQIHEKYQEVLKRSGHYPHASCSAACLKSILDLFGF